MIRIPRIKSVMTPFPFSIAGAAPVSEAIEFMRKENIRHLPVTDNGNLIGMISDRDIKLGVLTAIVGAPFFFWLVWSHRRAGL